MVVNDLFVGKGRKEQKQTFISALDGFSEEQVKVWSYAYLRICFGDVNSPEASGWKSSEPMNDNFPPGWFQHVILSPGSDNLLNKYKEKDYITDDDSEISSLSSSSSMLNDPKVHQYEYTLLFENKTRIIERRGEDRLVSNTFNGQ